MSTCERCWSDAHHDPYLSVVEEYHRFLTERVGDKCCTPEEQAGRDAAPCVECGGRLVRHEITGECMANGRHGFVKRRP